MARRLDRLGLEFQADFLAALTRRHPGNLEALSELGHVLTRLGRFAEGLEADQRLARILPEDPLVQYNLACSQCLMDRHLEALDSLELAIELGYDDPGHMATDEDLTALRGQERFERLLRRLEAAID